MLTCHCCLSACICKYVELYAIDFMRRFHVSSSLAQSVSGYLGVYTAVYQKNENLIWMMVGLGTL